VGGGEEIFSLLARAPAVCSGRSRVNGGPKGFSFRGREQTVLLGMYDQVLGMNTHRKYRYQVRYMQTDPYHMYPVYPTPALPEPF
jgi:hypothetical protein